MEGVRGFSGREKRGETFPLFPFFLNQVSSLREERCHYYRTGSVSYLPASLTHQVHTHTHTQRCIVGWFQWLLLRRLLLPSLPDGNKEANVSARAGDTLEKERGTDPGRCYFKDSQPHTLAGMGKPSEAKAGGSTGPPSRHSNLLGSV